MRAACLLLCLLVLVPGAPPVSAQGTADAWPALIQRQEQQVARTPDDPSARFTLAMLYARAGRLLDGYKQLREAERAAGGPTGVEPLRRQIAADAEALVRANPRDLLARYRLAFVRFFQRDLKGSAAEFEQIIAVDPRNDWGYGYLGQSYSNLGQIDRAIRAWERGIAINPNNAVIHYMLGLAYTKKNDKKKAAGHFAAAYRDRTLYEYVTGGKTL